MNKFVFLLCPPLSGSTMIKELFESSEAVSTFYGEGQFFAEAHNIIGRGVPRWDPNLKVNWELLKQIFFKYWNLEKPVLFEKSPPHLLRALEIEKVFTPAYFIISIRNPYAQIEGLWRRKWMPSPTAAAELWVLCARYQIKNLNTLKSKIFFRYEDFTDNIDLFLEKIKEFIPEVGVLNKNKAFHAHNITGKPLHGIVNLNDRKFKLLKPEVIKEVNEVFKLNEDLLKYFNYNLIEVEK
ncbi:hypothetical protein GM661_06645 [Iocasia frigidifontis]|uniref:Sulfotransferase n=1 Tax=Iocasia fonsfrigidae TaxID=2682810 RepID=A0A8A7K7K0_9FIRM|nr:sulfotransferase [Iocasia fonsfrigidae]QTL97686.1 hypothetical protein GM661_06645 [Iocasia fonsfrigidae]